MASTGVNTKQVQDGSVTAAKMNSEAAADGTVLTADGSGGQAYEALPVTPVLLDTDFGARSVVVNSTTYTTIYSVTLAAGLLGSANAAVMHCYGHYLQATGSNRALTLRVRLGDGSSTVTLWEAGMTAIGSHSGVRPYSAELVLAAGGNTGTVQLNGFISCEVAPNDPTTGFGFLDSSTRAKSASLWNNDSFTFSTGSALTLDFDVALGFASANYQWTHTAGYVQKIAA